MSPRRGKKPKISLPSPEYSQRFPPQISFTPTKQFKAAFKHLRKLCSFVKPPVLGRNINDRLQVDVFLLPTTTNIIYDCWFKCIFMRLIFSPP